MNLKELAGNFAFGELLERVFPKWFDPGNAKNETGKKGVGAVTEKSGLGGIGKADELFEQLAEYFARTSIGGPEITVEELRIIFSAVDGLGKPSYKRDLLQTIGHQATSGDKKNDGRLINREGAIVLTNLAYEIRNVCPGKIFNETVKPTKTELAKAQKAVIDHLFHRGILRNVEEEVKEVVDGLERVGNAILKKLSLDGPEAEKWLDKKNQGIKKELATVRAINRNKGSKRPKLWQVAAACTVLVVVVCIIF
jgi:hypothetical protein